MSQQSPNAIGNFTIGVSSIGDEPFDWRQTIQSKFATATNLLTYLDFLAQNVDATNNIEVFFDQVWNIDTAEGWGLDFWGEIVGLPNGRTLTVTTQYLGFEEASDISEVGFNQAPLYSGAALTSNFELEDDAFRLLILAKAAANISDGSILSINTILRTLFGASGICYCTDGGDMTMTYTFGFALSPVQIAIIQGSGVLPRPAGVSVTIVQT